VTISDTTAPGTATDPAPPRSFEGKVALVTGSSDGIGAATARLLADRGARVAINYHSDADRAQATLATLTATGAEAAVFRADVTDEAESRRLAEEVTAQLGPVDVLVLNAAGLYGHDVVHKPFLDLTWPETERIVLRRIQALFHPLKAVLPSMLERGHGSVVVVGSSLSRVPAAGMVAISMASAALEVAVKGLARELGPQGIRVNAVAPNFVLTASTSWAPADFKAMVAQRSAVGRNGLPEDVAEAIVFLAGDQAAYFTGSYLIADGGTAML
jgi:3-oxoacyl-[acyl-carrier protein] reductase